MTTTLLDSAHAAMLTNPTDDKLRLRFYERLADNELYLLLEREAEGDNITPAIFDTGEGRFALIFDREWRLTEFTGISSPFAALSGRTIASLLTGHGIGLGVNLDVAPSSILIPSDAVDWLHQTLAARPIEVDAMPEEVRPPEGVPEALLTGIDTKLAGAPGLADFATLNFVVWNDGRRGHLLSFIGPAPGAEPALAQAASEALIFSGIDAGELDVAFFRADDPIGTRLAAAGVRFDIPDRDQLTVPSAPGMNPDKPPKLV